MERLPRQKYTKEFREQAVGVVLDQELTIPEAARRLTMSERRSRTGCLGRGRGGWRGWGTPYGRSSISKPRCLASNGSWPRLVWSATS